MALLTTVNSTELCDRDEKQSVDEYYVSNKQQSMQYKQSDHHKRSGQLKLFISSHFPQPYSFEPMVGDAGMRSYYRVKDNKTSFVVMDCPPDYAEVEIFANISKFLLERGFSAPQVFKQNLEQGFLLLEDFGNVSIKKYLETGGKSTEKRKQIYCLIIDLLVSLQSKDRLSTLKEFDNEMLCKELEVFIDWYVPYAYKRKLKVHELEEFIKLWQSVLAQKVPMPRAMVLRDYHLENMMYLEQRSSVQKIGLLDFQDALWGSPIYDLVSVLEDARFDVPRNEALDLIDYFVIKTGLNKDAVLLNYHVLGAQRNCRILGVFARKAIRDGNDGYLKYIPRVQGYLRYDLSHPVLSEIKIWFSKLK
ncbi:MAG: phosphotransferase [Rickettsiaceae bacterium]